MCAAGVGWVCCAVNFVAGLTSFVPSDLMLTFGLCGCVNHNVVVGSGGLWLAQSFAVAHPRLLLIECCTCTY